MRYPRFLRRAHTMAIFVLDRNVNHLGALTVSRVVALWKSPILLAGESRRLGHIDLAMETAEYNNMDGVGRFELRRRTLLLVETEMAGTPTTLDIDTLEPY